MMVDIHPAPITLDDAKLATALRAKSVDLTQRKLLMTRFPGSDSRGPDATTDCAGFGRLHHFRERMMNGG